MKTAKCVGAAATGLALIASVVAVTPAAAEPTGRIVLTNTDNGRSVHAKTGDTIEVRLTGYRDHGVTYSWSVPQSAEPQVLHRVAGTAKPGGGASAVFHAEREGTVTLSARRACHPDAGRTCPYVVTPWKITATVK